MPREHHPHTDSSLTALQAAIRHHVRYSLGKEWQHLLGAELFRAVALAVRDRLVDRMLATEARYRQAQAKRLYYLSIEFLMGRSLRNNLSNLGLFELCQEALRTMGVDLADIEENERDAALGNGGLGRLAACFLDSLATLNMPGYGYGIHYDYGLFQQEISNGYQKERPDNWLAYGTPWEIERIDEACLIPVYGHIEHSVDRAGQYNPMWMGWQILIGVPHDIPIVGYGGRTVNYLRLYAARASTEFDMRIFNGGMLSQGRRVEDRLGDHYQGAVSPERSGGWPGTPAGPGVLSGGLRHTGYCQTLSPDPYDLRGVLLPGSHSAQ
jgi:starch phosphorylase